MEDGWATDNSRDLSFSLILINAPVYAMHEVYMHGLVVWVPKLILGYHGLHHTVRDRAAAISYITEDQFCVGVYAHSHTRDACACTHTHTHCMHTHTQTHSIMERYIINDLCVWERATYEKHKEHAIDKLLCS